MPLPCIQLDMHQNSQVLFYRAAFHLGGLQHVLVFGVAPAQARDSALILLLELREILVSIPFQTVKVLLSQTLAPVSCHLQI